MKSLPTEPQIGHNTLVTVMSQEYLYVNMFIFYSGNDDDDMFLHHYIANKVSRGHKTRLSLHNTMLKSKLFVQFVKMIHVFAEFVQI